MHAFCKLVLSVGLAACAADAGAAERDPDLVASQDAAAFELAAAPERLAEYVQQFRDIIDALRVGDARAAMEARMDADEWARERTSWEERRQRTLEQREEAMRKAVAAKDAASVAPAETVSNAPTDTSTDGASDSAFDGPHAPQSDVTDIYNPWQRFEEYWAQLRTTEGTEDFIAEWQPKLAAFGSQKVIEFNLGIAVMLQGIQQDQNMSAEEIAQASELVLALQRWANTIDWNDSVRFRRAVLVAADVVRESKLAFAADLQTLSHDDAMTLLNSTFRAVKRVMAIYDLDPDPILASVTFGVLNESPTRAKMVIKLRALDVPMAFTQALAYQDGRWMDANVAEMMGDWSEAPAPEALQPDRPAADTQD